MHNGVEEDKRGDGKLWASRTCLRQRLPNAARARSGAHGRRVLAMKYSMRGLEDDVQHFADGGGRERVAHCLCTSATAQTPSYNVQIPENQRKQICTGQAEEHTYKRPKTGPSRRSLFPPHGLADVSVLELRTLHNRRVGQGADGDIFWERYQY